MEQECHCVQSVVSLGPVPCRACSTAGGADTVPELDAARRFLLSAATRVFPFRERRLQKDADLLARLRVDFVHPGRAVFQQT